MLTYIKGDLFNSPAQVLVNTVNTVGVMGKGIALEFKKKYPEMFETYQQVCEEKKFDIGNLMLWKKSEKWVLLFPTKKHWRSPSDISYIEKGLQNFVESYESLGIESIAFPKLGCGNGGLNWNIVKKLMEKYLKNLPIHIYIYIDKYTESISEFEEPTEIEKWINNNIKLVGFEKIKEDLIKNIKVNNDFLINDSELKHISWEEDEIHIINGSEIIIPVDEFSDFWEYISDLGVIEIEKLPFRFKEYATLMLDILKRLKYLEPIIIINNEKDDFEKAKGYQYLNA